MADDTRPRGSANRYFLAKSISDVPVRREMNDLRRWVIAGIMAFDGASSVSTVVEFSTHTCLHTLTSAGEN